MSIDHPYTLKSMPTLTLVSGSPPPALPVPAARLQKNYICPYRGLKSRDRKLRFFLDSCRFSTDKFRPWMHCLVFSFCLKFPPNAWVLPQILYLKNQTCWNVRGRRSHDTAAHTREATSDDRRRQNTVTPLATIGARHLPTPNRTTSVLLAQAEQ